MSFNSSVNNTKVVKREFLIKTILGEVNTIPVFSASGTIDASISLVIIDAVPASEKLKLDDPANWTGHQYTGTPLVDCLQGTEYENGIFIFKFVADNQVRRMQFI